jgi:hypothetical protein
MEVQVSREAEGGLLELSVVLNRRLPPSLKLLGTGERAV